MARPIPREAPVTSAVLLVKPGSLTCFSFMFRFPFGNRHIGSTTLPNGRPAMMYRRASAASARGKGPGHYRFDRAGFKLGDNNFPGVNNGRLRLSKHVETLDAGLWHDETRHVNRRLTACGISERYDASFRREHSKLFTQDFATDSVDDDVRARTARDTTHAVTQFFH